MNENPVITFVSHTNKPGGGELALRRYLESTDLRVRLVTMETGGVWEGLGTETVHAAGLTGLCKALRGGGLVVANSMRAAFVTSLLAPRRTRLVYWVRDGLTDSAMSPLSLALTRRVTARRASHYLANSEWTARSVRTALKVGPERVDVVHSMCGISERGIASSRTSPARPLRLLYLGRLSEWKAPHVAIQALELLRARGIEATLTIAGDALFGEHAYGQSLQTLAAETEGVAFVGHVDDVDALLDRHDLTMHCSVRPEPFGQVIVQSLAAGVPVVATAGGGPAEIVQGSPVDLLYAPGDPAALATGIERVLGSYAVLSDWAVNRAVTYADQDAAARTDATLDLLQRGFVSATGYGGHH